MTARLSRIAGRGDIAHFLNQKNLVGHAAEIGTNQGEFAVQFLQSWKGKKLYCIDSYESGYDPSDPLGVPGLDRKKDMQMWHLNTHAYESRIHLISETSLVASKMVSDGRLDFAYIDACHLFKAVLDNLREWWPKVRRGGYLGGHDIIWGENPADPNHRQVEKAVRKFAREVDVKEILYIPELPMRNWSYLLEKK